MRGVINFRSEKEERCEDEAGEDYTEDEAEEEDDEDDDGIDEDEEADDLEAEAEQALDAGDFSKANEKSVKSIGILLSISSAWIPADCTSAPIV